MGYQTFDKYASEYDAWFIENQNVLECEVRLVAACLEKGKKILSIGCGSGLFEKIIKDKYGIEVQKGIEPAAAIVEDVMAGAERLLTTALARINE